MNPGVIVRVGDTLLNREAESVTNFGTKALNELVEYLFYNLKHYSGAGLAAPQVGESKKIIVYGFEKNPRYPNEKPVPLTVLINPEIIARSDEEIGYYEGCLSVPHLRGLVTRSISIHYKGYTSEGELVEREVSGFEARIIQHEIDHINGILFPMRMTDMSTLQYSEN